MRKYQVLPELRMQPLDRTVHKLIAHTCVEFAGAEYEELAKDDDFYKEWPNQKEYIQLRAPYLKQTAKEVLGSMLAMDHVSEAEKETIFQALCLDNMLPKSGTGVIKK